MVRFSKAFWYISIVFFLISLFYFYAGMTERTTYSGSLGVLNSINSHQLFYISLGTVVIINVLCVSLVKLLSLKKMNGLLLDLWNGGLYGFAAMANFFMISSLFTLLFIENEMSNLYYLAYIGPVILVGWLVIFLVNLFQTLPKIKKSI